MPEKFSLKSTMKSLMGLGFLAIGTAVMLTECWSLASRFGSLLAAPAGDSLGALTEFGLASLRVLQSVVFDHSMLLSLSNSFLISFTAFGITLAGLALLRKRTPKAGAR